MGNVTSTLTMRLIDGITGPAKRIRGALAGVDAAAKRSQATHGALAGGRGGHAGGSTTLLAGAGTMRAAAGFGAAYMVARTVKEGYVRFAEADRRLTRIRQTADASAAEGARAQERVRAIAAETGLAVDQVTSGVEELVAAGRSLPAAMDFLPSVARTAQASGAEVADIAKTADAIGSSMKIAGSEMERAFDVLVTQGKAGKFELKDMAHYLPSLAPAAAAVGMRGVEGLNKLAAMLQVIRNQTGSAEDAAVSAQNIFNKMETDETTKKFAKFGINLRKEMAKAREQGRDLTEVFVDLADKAIKGDLSKIPQLFADDQFARGMRALISQRDVLKAFIANIHKAAGAVKNDLTDPANDAASAIQKLSGAWDHALVGLGKVAHAAGATSFLEGFAAVADRGASNIERLTENVKKLGAVNGALKFFEQNDQIEAARLKAETDAAEAKRGRPLPTVEETIAADKARHRLVQALAELDHREKTFTATDERWRGRKLPTEAEAQRGAALADLARLRQEITALIVETMPKLPTTLQGIPELPHGGRVLGERVSGATRARPRANLGTSSPTDPTVSPLIIQLDDAAATAAANAARAKVQAVLDANPPVIRPRVEVPNISGALGKSVSDGVNGSHSDNGGRR